MSVDRRKFAEAKKWLNKQVEVTRDAYVHMDFLVSTLEDVIQEEDNPKEQTIKIVLNREFGGFSISTEALEWLRKNGSEEAEETTYIPGQKSYLTYNDQRSHPLLVRCVEELGSKRASGENSRLEVWYFTIPTYAIIDQDGMESLSESGYGY